MLAGSDWFKESFARGLRVEFEEWTPGGLVEKVGNRNGQRWVLAKHPMRKPEGKMTEQIAEAFGCTG